VKRGVIVSGPARRDIRRLDASVASRVVEAISRYAETEQGDVIRLRGIENEFRLRVGDWRVRFRLVDLNSMIEIIRVLPRGRAYRD